MELQIITVIFITIPVMIFPVTAVWYLNPGGIFTTFKETRVGRAGREKTGKEL
jgi:lipopolysaccharide/colanic/teichoic acid biosynthesis glycosyltransferase